MNRLTRRAGLAGLALLPLARPALAQAPWAPTRPLRVLVGFPPGGGADTVARRIAEALTPALGQPVVVENRPGAGAQIAVDAVAKAPPDGTVIGFSPLGPLAVNPVLTPGRLPYDATKDFTPLAHVWDQPNLLVGSLAVPADWPAFLAWLRARPEEPFASVGPGTSNHLTGEMLSRALGLRLQHVPYRGTPAALTDVLGGRINLFVDNVQGSFMLAREGKVRALAVTTERRVDVLPDVPSMAELGLPEVTVSSWQLIIGPARLPPAIVARLSDEIEKAIRTPEMQAWMASIGSQPAGGGHQAAVAMLAREQERWARAIPPLNIRLDSTAMKRFDLTGRVALVTGGNGGIGLGMARGLAEAGATVVIAGRNAAKNETALAELAAIGAASAVVADVTEEAACAAMVAETVRRHGRLDILVNNAGRPSANPPQAMPIAEWHAIMDANLTSAVMCSQAAHAEMKRAGGGKVINVASVAANISAPVMGAYSASKAGMLGFTRACAAAWAADNIQVNAVLPGWIATDMTKRRQDDEAFNAKLLARVPAGRWGTPEDFAGVAVFLASAASDFMTGASLTLDGGYTFAI